MKNNTKHKQDLAIEETNFETEFDVTKVNAF